MKFRILAGVALSVSLTLLSGCNSDQPGADSHQKADIVLEDTLTMLNQAIVNQPAAVAPYLERANFFIKKDSLNLALKDVNSALEIEENNPETYAVLSDVYLYSGKVQRALDALKKAQELNASNAQFDVKMARIYLTMSDYKQTFESLRKALKKNPENVEALFISGLANEEMGDTAKAIENYQMTVARNQKHFDALKQLGILFAIKKDRLAIDYLRNAFTVRPGSVEPLYILGMFYQENNDPDKALNVYNEILLIRPDYKLAQYNKGYVYLIYKEDYPEAISAFTEAIQLDAAYADAYFNRGYAYELSGNKEKAREDYRKVLTMSVNDEKAVTALNRLDQK
ncbi:MAG: tetratricopeptide repeat protein [Lentimicrobium sp.]|jgi:tetratricopeptide (TPR) repeat protein|nr:tetratricopeptide repeat protein [Lentimicrobium sp.]